VLFLLANGTKSLSSACLSADINLVPNLTLDLSPALSFDEDYYLG